ncbi:hypothetical protein C8F01DRAFT_1042857 [Mycena amicta]|nr:hypothetical protein C8F01DRAFT_1042857 [Mycena amicta]
MQAGDLVRLTKVNEEIKQLRSALHARYSERQVLHERINTLTCPAVKLPVEIITEIFKQYVPAYPACPPLLGLASPTTLAQVCRLWRNVAHSTPALWRGIKLFSSIVSDSDSDSDSDDSDSDASPDHLRFAMAQIDVMVLWLRRSATQRLSILVGEKFGSFNHLRITALAILLGHDTRWEYFSMRLWAESGEVLLLRGEFPSLLVLDLESGGNGDDDEMQFGPLDMPSLRSAFLRLSGPQEDLRERLQWDQVTKLMVARLTPADAAMLLELTPNVVHCWLDIYAEDGIDTVPTSLAPAQLTQLETLILDNDENYPPVEGVLAILGSLWLPRLHHLCIFEKLLLSYPIDSDRLSVVIETLGCGNLQRLQITGTTDPEATSVDSYLLAFTPIAAHIQVVPRGLDGDPDLDPEEWGYWSLVDLDNDRQIQEATEQ